VLELEQVGVAVLDHDRGSRDRRHLGESVGELTADEPAGEVGEALALDDGDDLHAVVADRERRRSAMACWWAIRSG
jgi:hypothetical protein